MTDNDRLSPSAWAGGYGCPDHSTPDPSCETCTEATRRNDALAASDKAVSDRLMDWYRVSKELDEAVALLHKVADCPTLNERTDSCASQAREFIERHEASAVRAGTDAPETVVRDGATGLPIKRSTRCAQGVHVECKGYAGVGRYCMCDCHPEPGDPAKWAHVESTDVERAVPERASGLGSVSEAEPLRTFTPQGSSAHESGKDAENEYSPKVSTRCQQGAHVMCPVNLLHGPCACECHAVVHDAGTDYRWCGYDRVHRHHDWREAAGRGAEWHCPGVSVQPSYLIDPPAISPAAEAHVDPMQKVLRDQGMCGAYIDAEHTRACILNPKDHAHPLADSASSEAPDDPAGEPAARHKGPQGSVERGGGVTRDSEGDRLSPVSTEAERKYEKALKVIARTTRDPEAKYQAHKALGCDHYWLPEGTAPTYDRCQNCGKVKPLGASDDGTGAST